MSTLLLSDLAPNPIGQGFLGVIAATTTTTTPVVTTTAPSEVGFRAMFPAFADTTAYPDATIAAYTTFAQNYISSGPYSSLSPSQQTLALQLMTAHLLQLTAQGTSGQSAGFITSKTIRDVNYTVAAPPASSQFQYWLNLTVYGMQLYTLLTVQSVGGFNLAGGYPEIQAFRRFSGLF